MLDLRASMLVVLLVWATQVSHRAHAEPIRAGSHVQTVMLRGNPLEVFTFRPPGCTTQSLLLAFHGSEHSAQAARANTRHFAERDCLTVLAPLLDREHFPPWRYAQGGMAEHGILQPPESWTGNLALDLVAWARGEIGRPLPYSMIGHSAGGQYLQRLAAFVPNEAHRIVVANPGAHVLPSLDVNAPYGLGKVYSASSGDDALKRYLAQPLTLMLGEKDTEPNPQFGAQAKAQGSNRLERGLSTYEAARTLGERQGWPVNWILIRIPNVGHSSRDMYAAPQAAKLFSR
jgi:pimeloyl-ACP methyl ester carboxylesterase